MATFKIKEHVAIITGSAQGFGKEFAIRLLKEGGKVCISDKNEEMGATVVSELKEIYGTGSVTFRGCDVTKSEDWERLWDHAENYFEHQVTLLVNNAGVNPSFGWSTCNAIMLTGVCLGTFMAIERMSTAKGKIGGRIVNIGSMASFLEGMRNIEEAGYTVAKSGVAALTRSFSQRGRNGPLKRDGIKAIAICPWFANTDLVSSTVDIKQLETRMKKRVLQVSEVGDSFMEALEIDKAGACYVVFPDCPLLDFPNVNFPLMAVMIAFGQFVCSPLRVKAFGLSEVLFCFLLVAVTCQFLFAFILIYFF